MINPNELADRYVAMFNDPDPERRRAAVKELWSTGAVQVLNPPQEVREVADALAMSPIFESRGHAELEARVTRAYEQFASKYEFRRSGDAARLQDVLTFRWEAILRDSGEPDGAGRHVFMLDADGRIRRDYLFVE
jgi:hypothetical protein